MGSLQAQEMAEHADLDTALYWQLRSNHYPPVPSSMISVCKEVILWANEDGDLKQEFALPKDVSYKGSNKAPAWAIIEAHHLDSFLD